MKFTSSAIIYPNNNLIGQYKKSRLFFLGFAMVWDIFNSISHKNGFQYNILSNEEAMQQDWVIVGEDILSSINQNNISHTDE